MRTRMIGIWLLAGLLATGGQALAQEATAAGADGRKPRPAVAGQAPAGAVRPDAAKDAGQAGRPDGKRPAKPSHPVKGSPAVEAGEKRYEDYLAREKAASDAALARQRGRMEDKYKGFVRTVKPREGSKAAAKKGAE